jgi:hypothetical protein
MARRLTRSDLLTEATAEYAKLAALIERVKERDLRESCVNSGGWSLKDVLAHVADWADRCAGWCEAGLRGENPQAPAPGLKWNQFPLLNAQIYRRHRKRAAKRILAEFHEGHARLCALADRIPEADLYEPRRFMWCGPTWAVANHIRANTSSHYRWAQKHFRRWLGRQKAHSAAS